MAVQAPIVKDPRKWDYTYNDREEMIVKQNALNQWRYDFSQQLTAMVEALNGEFQYVAETRIDITKKAGQVAADRQHVDAQKKAVDTAKSHVDAQKKAIDTTAGEVDANARQVAADKGEVATDRQAAAQSASAASGSAKAAQTARNQAEGLYGDLSAVNAAKTATQQAAQTAGQQAQAAGHSAEQANTARSGAEAALAKALKAAADANVDVDAAIAALVDSSPDALNTLNELAAALGDDPNFASTVNSELAKKLDKGHATAANPHPQYLLMDGALTWNGQKFGTVLVHDARDLDSDGRNSSYLPTPDDMPDRALTALFSVGLPGNSWRSALVMSGWNDGYASWMLTGPSGTGVDEDYYLTSGRSGEWGADRKIWHDGNFNPTDYIPASGGNLGNNEIRARLTHNSGYFTLYPYNSSYGDGYLRIYWNDNDKELNMGGATLRNVSVRNGDITGRKAVTDMDLVGPGSSDTAATVFALQADGRSPTIRDDVHKARAAGMYYGLSTANAPDGNGHYFWSNYSANYQKYLYLPQNSTPRGFIGGNHNGVWHEPAEIWTDFNFDPETKLDKSGGLLTGRLRFNSDEAPNKEIVFEDANGNEYAFLEAGDYGVRIRARGPGGGSVVTSLTIGSDGKVTPDIGRGFYGAGSGLTNLDAASIDRGWLDFARVPSTSNRFSSSTSHALEAAAMSAHRTSGDHDDRYARPDSEQYWTGVQTFRATTLMEGPNGAYTRTNARDDGDSTRVHSYTTKPGSGSAHQFLQAWYGGSSYTNVTTTNDGVEFDKSLTTTELRLTDGVTLKGTTNALEISRSAGSVEIGNRNSGYTHYSSSAGNHYFYGKLHSQSGFYGDGSGLTNLDAGNIDRGTISLARVPTTSSRYSSSTSHALEAAAMNAHRTSGDHDSRYYTKSEVDNLAKMQTDFRKVGAYIIAKVLNYGDVVNAGETIEGSKIHGVTPTGETFYKSFEGTWMAMSASEYADRPYTGLFLRIA